MRIKTLLILCLCLIALLLPQQVAAQDCSTVATGTVDNFVYQFPTDQIDSRLVRWLDGTLWTALAMDYGLNHQVHVYYSVDNGLNWHLSYRTVEGNDGAAMPVLAGASNNDLCLLYIAVEDGVSYDVKGAMYDAGTDTWTNDGTIYSGQPVGDITLEVGGNDTFHAGYFRYVSGCNHRINYIYRNYLGDGDWDDWTAPYEVEISACVGGVSMAVSQEGDIGFIYGDGSTDIYSNIYDVSLGTWSKDKVNDELYDWDYYANIMATIRGGVTYWIAAWEKRQDGFPDFTFCSEKTGAGAWAAEAATGLPDGRATLAQEQGGTTDTGNWFVMVGAVGGVIRYNEYEVGTGFLGVEEISCSTGVDFGIWATKALFPYSEEYGWHWNLQADDFAMTYYDAGADSGWDDGDELIRYWDSASSWGIFRPMIETGEPGNITTTSADFNGTINYTGGENPDEIGWEYGFTQTATWTETLSGNFTAGYYSATVTNLEADELYYVRFYATNSTGTSYGAWIGFLSGLPGAEGGEPSQPDEPDEGMSPPVPTVGPDGWVTDPDDRDFDEWPIAGVINPFADLIGRSFVWFLLMVFGVGFVGIVLCRFTRHLGIVFLALGGVLGWYMGSDYMDWWPMLPYLLVGICLIVIERQYSLSN